MFFFAFKETETYCRFLEFFSPGPHFVICAVVIRAVHATGNAFVITATFTYAAVEFENSVGTIFVNTAFFSAFFCSYAKSRLIVCPSFAIPELDPFCDELCSTLGTVDRRCHLPGWRLLPSFRCDGLTSNVDGSFEHILPTPIT